MPMVTTLVDVYELNGNILRASLKESTVWIFRRQSGSSFQVFGAAIEIERSPKSGIDVLY